MSKRSQMGSGSVWPRSLSSFEMTILHYLSFRAEREIFLPFESRVPGGEAPGTRAAGFKFNSSDFWAQASMCLTFRF